MTVNCEALEHDGGIGAEWEQVGKGSIVVRTTGNHMIRLNTFRDEGDVTVNFVVEVIGSMGQPLTVGTSATSLYQLHVDGLIWRYTGTPCNADACPGWQLVDRNPRTKAIVAAEAQLYQLHVDGMIWRYIGISCNADACPGWELVDRNPRTEVIVAGGNQLYQCHVDGMIWRYTGTPCNVNACPGWELLDRNPRIKAIAAGNK